MARTSGCRGRQSPARCRVPIGIWPDRARDLSRPLIDAGLVKNPVGFNEDSRMLTVATNGLTVPTLIAINDLAADGRDVSWLWDVDFEMLSKGSAPLFTTGIRGADMANRLKYAGVSAERIMPLPADLVSGLDVFVDASATVRWDTSC